MALGSATSVHPAFLRGEAGCDQRLGMDEILAGYMGFRVNI